MKSPTFILLALLTSFIARADDNWPQWRGPRGNSVSDSKNLPTTWSADKNIAWKTPLPSWSGSTPVIWGNHIFLTSPSKTDTNAPAGAQEERRGGGRGGAGGSYGVSDPGGDALLLLAISKKDGSILWQHEMDRGNKLYRKGNSVSPSPITDGKHVWTVTGNGVVTALDMAGKKIWTKNLRDYGNYKHNWGYGSTPLLVDGILIIEMLQGYGEGGSYVVALDGATGKQIWKQDRPTDAVRESPDAYTTPALLTHGGKKQIVINGGDYVTGHDLETGAEIWRGGGLNPGKNANYRVIASVTVDNANGLIFTPTRVKPFITFKAGGKGNISDTEHQAWAYTQEGAPDVPSPVSDGTYLYLVADNGAITCLESKTGKKVWGPERTAVGTVSASPLLADGKIYITNEKAVTTVVATGPEFKNLGTNELDGSYTLSSLAVSGSQLFARTSSHLYCISEKK